MIARWPVPARLSPAGARSTSMARPNSAIQATNGSISFRAKPPASAMIAMKYTPMPGTISIRVNSTSRTASAVCITLVVTRPENSSEKNERLCRSIRRWKSQRNRSGRLMARIWCWTIVRSATRPMLVSSTMPMPHSTRTFLRGGFTTGFPGREQVHDLAEKGKQPGFVDRHTGTQQRECKNVAARAPGAGPQKTRAKPTGGGGASSGGKGSSRCSNTLSMSGLRN
jgi:hypothetical protein